MCFWCARESFLVEEIEKNGARATCSYCGEEGNTFSVDQIADAVGIILAEFYHRTDYHDDTDPPDGRPVQEVISELAVTDAAIADDVRSVLLERHSAEKEEGQFEDNPFDSEVRYARNKSADTEDFESDWYDFEKSLKTQTRYFNKHAEYVLASIFDGIDAYRTRSGRSVIVAAGPGTALTTLYRAREFQKERELREAMKRPNSEIGPPPASKAVAGRMNASGVCRILRGHRSRRSARRGAAARRL